MKTPLSTTTVPAAPAAEPSGMTFEERVRERRKREEAREEQRRRDRAAYQARYRDEPLLKKVERLAQKRWLDYDAIRWEVEAFLPLANPTPAQIRDYREQIARLVNQYRRDIGWR